MNAEHRIYSIGYGNRPFDDFLKLLRRHRIDAVADVRSTPHSARFPDFSQPSFESRAKSEGLKYVFLGDLLGARPSDPELYENGRASYDAMARSSAFRQGLERVESGSEKFSIALLCAEKDPIDCHRAILIARHLIREGYNVTHVDADGELETHSELELRLLKLYKLDQTSLFGADSVAAVLSEAYDRRGRELAYDVDAAYRARIVL
jgi:uncharacterized protein (DUF488 family)